MNFPDFTAILDLARNRAPEGLQLEFKEKNSPHKHDLDNGDKKGIAKAVCAFANSGGGTLIPGVRSARVGDVDVAEEIIPISEVELCRVQVEYICKTNVSPEIPGVIVTAVSGTDGAGVVVCTIPASERRPHMSTAPGVHTYYRRTFQGNVPMTPFEVQEQVLAVREAVLKPVVQLSRGASFSTINDWVAIGYSVQFSLENIGNRACLNPFIRVRSSENTKSHAAIWDRRQRLWKSKIPFGTLIHTDDELAFFTFDFIARMLMSNMQLGSTASENDLLNAVKLYSGRDDLHARGLDENLEIEGLNFKITYGAENSASRTQSFEFDRNYIAARLLIQSEEHLRDRAQKTVGIWRSDLVEKLKSAYPAH